LGGDVTGLSDPMKVSNIRSHSLGSIGGVSSGRTEHVIPKISKGLQSVSGLCKSIQNGIRKRSTMTYAASILRIQKMLESGNYPHPNSRAKDILRGFERLKPKKLRIICRPLHM